MLTPEEIDEIKAAILPVAEQRATAIANAAADSIKRTPLSPETSALIEEEVKKRVAERLAKWGIKLGITNLVVAGTIAFAVYAGADTIAKEKATTIAETKAAETVNTAIKEPLTEAQKQLRGIDQSLDGLELVDLVRLKSRAQTIGDGLSGIEQGKANDYAAKAAALDKLTENSNNAIDSFNKYEKQVAALNDVLNSKAVMTGKKYRILSNHDRKDWLYLEASFEGGGHPVLQEYHGGYDQAWDFQEWK